MHERVSGRLRCRLLALAPFLPFCVTAISSHAQNRDALCSNGSGNFEAEFRGGVELRVGAAKNGSGLATRACAAKLTWNRQELVVANETSQLDVDVFGADLGMGVPVVAFQIKKSDAECCMTYQIYSLQKPPRLLRSITGGNFFSASDKDLDGRIEIWVNEAAALDGFENLVIDELDFAPTVVLRFERSRLLDVSSEFQPYFDHEIDKLRAELKPGDLQDFKNSDGKLASAVPSSGQRLHQLRGVKIKLLEIAWSYLYSGREAKAWHFLADMWPGGDLERIQAAVVNARAHGIHAQVDGSSSAQTARRKKHVVFFDATRRSEQSGSEVTPPQSILMRRPAPLAAEQGLTDSELLLDLLIDSAGKVRSAEPAGNAKSSDMDLVRAAMEWTFVPAFKDGRAVASHLRLAVSAKR